MLDNYRVNLEIEAKNNPLLHTVSPDSTLEMTEATIAMNHVIECLCVLEDMGQVIPWHRLDRLARQREVYYLPLNHPSFKPYLETACEAVERWHEAKDRIPPRNLDLDTLHALYEFVHQVDVRGWTLEQVERLEPSQERDSIIAHYEAKVNTPKPRCCPHCHSEKLESKGKSRHGASRWKCRNCGKSHTT